MQIKVMGPGCAKCAEAERIVRAAVEEAGVVAEIEKITDFQEMAKLGVLSTPAVAVDGQVKCSGKAPTREEVLAWLGK